MDLTITLSRRGDRSLVELTGSLDYGSVPYVRQLVFDRFDAGDRHVTVELSRLRLLDAAAIKVLLYLQRRGEQLDADVRLAGARGAALTALEISGVAKQLHAYDNVHWPVADRDRQEIDLDTLHLSHGHWPAEVTDLLARLHAMDPADPARQRARDQVIEMCLPAAQRLARRFGASGEPVNDLIQVASLGLVKAVDGFDPTRGIEFGTYATPTIIGEIKRYFRDRTWGIRLPRRLQELRLAVNKARDDLTQSLGRSPTVTDIANHLVVDEEQIIEVIGATHAYRPMSLDTPAGDVDDETTLLDAVGEEEPEFGLVDFRESLHTLIGRLPEREQRILSLRFYGNLTQSEIAERIGLSQMHVSRLLRQSLDFLRRRLSE
ncbi:SigB/SigF/SigG family RNA polymerase sigma factor [Dactylosporangium roseum]|uniref:SigB/SigF/SigG family RNA polymerase sigma factor n=1 Tax=Dactylosporangium roseum TaxID=47989 RepID=A0ABY5Z3M7_9ACTN|nr:SigB/SigF/SigG family RNA polymerase sigma factor [Dactylosporangium roseum]UWZ35069.1 SigB/SigF/SigG family RNA polymerase sigma factor [Dactylosporangium roseum]